MPDELFANNAASTLSAGIAAGDASLAVVLATAFPASGNFRIIIDNEIIIVGAVAGTTFSSLTRGAEGTTAASHSGGAAVTQILTAASVQTQTYRTALCSADTALSNSWVDITGCSLSLTAGTWLVMGAAQLLNSGGANAGGGAKIYNSTDSTDYVAHEAAVLAGFTLPIHLSTIIVIAAAKTIKLAGRLQVSSWSAKRFGDTDIGAASIPGTYIYALKIG